jgi:hypothetical protein
MALNFMYAAVSRAATQHPDPIRGKCNPKQRNSTHKLIWGICSLKKAKEIQGEACVKVLMPAWHATPVLVSTERMTHAAILAVHYFASGTAQDGTHSAQSASASRALRR